MPPAQKSQSLRPTRFLFPRYLGTWKRTRSRRPVAGTHTPRTSAPRLAWLDLFCKTSQQARKPPTSKTRPAAISEAIFHDTHVGHLVDRTSPSQPHQTPPSSRHQHNGRLRRHLRTGHAGGRVWPEQSSITRLRRRRFRGQHTPRSSKCELRCPTELLPERAASPGTFPTGHFRSAKADPYEPYFECHGVTKYGEETCAERE